MMIVNESKGSAELVLFLSSPLSTDMTIQVLDTPISATGKHYDYCT